MPFLIDGHNVIAALDDIDLEDPHDEAKLVMRLRSWSARTGRKVIVVFDGGLPGGPSQTLSTVDVKVIFAARHYTNADLVIHERVSALPDAENWTVVSSDREVRDRARDNGARTLTAQDFVSMLDRPTAPEKEKPDTITAAEVAAWLEVFTEPEEAVEAQPTTAPGGAAATSNQKARDKRSRKPRPGSDPEGQRHSRTIGEQLGMKAAPPPPPKPTGKPVEPSEEDVEAWLNVFHDDPDSQIPPPKLPKKPSPQPKRPAEPVVRKDGSLSEAEVDTWLTLFEARAAAEPEEQVQGSGGERAVGKSAGPRKKQPPRSEPRRVSPKLAKHQQSHAAGNVEEDKPTLSQEDLDLWHRLYGDEK